MYSGAALHRLSIVAATGIVATCLVSVWATMLPALAELLWLRRMLSLADATALHDAAGPSTAASAALLVSGVLFMLWLGRARRHLAEFDGRPIYSPGWTVGAWLIPIANLIMPGLVVADVARWSTADETVRRQLRRLVWVWWACYGTQSLGGSVLSIMRRQATIAVDRLAWVVLGQLLCWCLFLAAGALAIQMMRAIGRAQAMRAAASTAEPDPSVFPAFTMDDVRPA